MADSILKANPPPNTAGSPSRAENLKVLQTSERLDRPPPLVEETMTEDQKEINAVAGLAVVQEARDRPSRGGMRRGSNGRINLRAVADACVDAGLDPAAEIVRVLQSQKPVLDRSGNPVLDADGEQVFVDEIDMDTRLRTLNELLQYTQPKLKAVEVKMSGSLELPAEQLDARLQALIAKAVK